MVAERAADVNSTARSAHSRSLSADGAGRNDMVSMGAWMRISSRVMTGAAVSMSNRFLLLRYSKAV
jgi:hypothetical protein